MNSSSIPLNLDMSRDLSQSALARGKIYVPAWPGLRPADFLRPKYARELPFPLNSPNKASFYVARNAIYHLFRALRFQKGETVLVPNYHSGNEVWAIRAAGASISYYSIDRKLEPDLDELARLASFGARALYVIHFIGWPQPIQKLASFCRERNMILIEDCALSLLSEAGGQPLGRYGDYAVYCLYKTLPVPNGGVLVQNNHVMEELNRVELRSGSTVSVVGRIGELMLEYLRSRSEVLGKPLWRLKKAVGQKLTSLRVKRVPVGDISFNLGHVNLGMSPLCNRLLERFDYEEIRKKRRANYLLMEQKLAGRASLLDKKLDEGVCPLFFPVLVEDKHAAAQALCARGIGATEFWNQGDPAAKEGSLNARFLREHVLELPVHQGVTSSQVEYIADQVLRLKLHCQERRRL